MGCREPANLLSDTGTPQQKFFSALKHHTHLPEDALSKNLQWYRFPERTPTDLCYQMGIILNLDTTKVDNHVADLQFSGLCGRCRRDATDSSPVKCVQSQNTRNPQELSFRVFSRHPKPGRRNKTLKSSGNCQANCVSGSNG